VSSGAGPAPTKGDVGSSDEVGRTEATAGRADDGRRARSAANPLAPVIGSAARGGGVSQGPAPTKGDGGSSDEVGGSEATAGRADNGSGARRGGVSQGPLLRVDGLTVRHPGAASPAVDDVSFVLEPGVALGLVGRSGSGKSTVLWSIPGLLPGTARVSGRVCFDGTDVLTCGASALRSLRGRAIGVVPQEPMSALNPVMRVGDQVAETLVAHGASWRDARARAAALLDEVGLPRRCASAWAHELSGGQKQRALVAAAIANGPRLLLADEPTTALDPSIQLQLLDLLDRLRRERGMAMLFVSHDPAVVARVADRVCVMERGRIVDSGDPVSVWARRSRSAPLPKRAPGRAGSEPAVALAGARVVYGERGTFGGEGGVCAVDGVSFSVRRGETVGLVGASGSGKTSVGRAILGLVPLSAGVVTIAGQVVAGTRSSADRSLRARVQVVFQDPHASLDPLMTVNEALSEPMRSAPRADARRRVDGLLTEVGLDPDVYRDRYPHELSGGERQRVCIARALVPDPDCVVLDEAVSALDADVRGAILSVLGDLQARRSLAYLFISHDLRLVRALCDRMIVLDHGRVVEEGAPDAIIASPVSDAARRLVAAMLDEPAGDHPGAPPE
jgi:ABC-type glutathione transport system ATPase component